MKEKAEIILSVLKFILHLVFKGHMFFFSSSVAQEQHWD